jgi:hypothetical protein
LSRQDADQRVIWETENGYTGFAFIGLRRTKATTPMKAAIHRPQA